MIKDEYELEKGYVGCAESGQRLGASRGTEQTPVKVGDGEQVRDDTRTLRYKDQARSLRLISRQLEAMGRGWGSRSGERVL